MKSTPEEISEILEEMALASKALTSIITDICWHMRGSVSWEQAWNLTERQRRVMLNLIKKNIETTQKMRMPLL